MKSQDIVILFKLLSLHRMLQKASVIPHVTKKDGIFAVRSLEKFTGISKSQVNVSVNRMMDVGLLKSHRSKGVPQVNKQDLFKFVVYGLRFVFPAKPGELTRGIATSFAAKVCHLEEGLKSSGSLIPVWPDAQGHEKGLAIEPLHKNVRQVIQGDDYMYELLALTDMIRIEQARSRKLAVDRLRILLT